MVMGVEVRLPVSEGVHRTVLSKEEKRLRITHRAPGEEEEEPHAQLQRHAPRRQRAVLCSCVSMPV